MDKITSENAPAKEINNFPNHRVLIKPEAQNNQKNKEMSRNEEKKALEAEKYGFQKDGQDRPLTKINSVKLNSLSSECKTALFFVLLALLSFTFIFAGLFLLDICFTGFVLLSNQGFFFQLIKGAHSHLM